MLCPIIFQFYVLLAPSTHTTDRRSPFLSHKTPRSQNALAQAMVRLDKASTDDTKAPEAVDPVPEAPMSPPASPPTSPARRRQRGSESPTPTSGAGVKDEAATDGAIDAAGSEGVDAMAVVADGDEGGDEGQEEGEIGVSVGGAAGVGIGAGGEGEPRMSVSGDEGEGGDGNGVTGGAAAVAVFAEVDGGDGGSGAASAVAAAAAGAAATDDNDDVGEDEEGAVVVSPTPSKSRGPVRVVAKTATEIAKKTENAKKDAVVAKSKVVNEQASKAATGWMAPAASVATKSSSSVGSREKSGGGGGGGKGNGAAPSPRRNTRTSK